MKKASTYFSDQQIKLIEQAVSHAEKNTSGEIVPVIASVSGRYDRAEDLFGLFFSLMILTIAWFCTAETNIIEGQWEAQTTGTLSLAWVLGIVFFSFLLGTLLAILFPSLSLLFISKQEMKEEVMRSAQQAFHQLRIHGTEEATGVLIYISLYEKNVQILGDATISAKLTQQDWDEVCQLAISGMKSRQAINQLVEAIELCGKLLSSHFPIAEDDQNELPNKLNFID